MVKLTVLYGQPTSAAAFGLPIAGKMQGVRKIELWKVIARRTAVHRPSIGRLISISTISTIQRA